MSQESRANAWRTWLGPLLVVLVALGVRVGYLVEFQGAPDFEAPAVDAGFHDDWARTLVGDEDWERPSHRPDPQFDRQPYFRPPGYPYFLAGVYALSGGCYLSPRLANMGLALVTLLLLMRFASQGFGQTAGWVCGLLFALNPMAVYFEGELHAVTPFLTVLLAAAVGAQAWHREPTVARALAVGALLGLAALFRPNALAFAVGSAAWIALRGPRRPHAAALLAGVTLALVPTTARNLRVTGEPIPITTNAGINLYLGNNPSADGQVAGELPGIGTFETCYDYPALERRVEELTGRELSPSEVSSWFTARALEWMGSQPAAFAGLTLHKFGLLFGPDDIGHNKVVALERERSVSLAWLPARFPVLLCLALGGLVLAVRQPSTHDRFSLGLVLGWSALYALSLLPFFIAARYRLPIEPLLAPLAALFLVRSWQAMRARQVGLLLLPGATVLVAALGLLFYPVRVQPDEVKWHVDRALAFSATGEHERALTEYDLALAIHPTSGGTHYRRGVTLEAMGRSAPARAAYERSAELDPSYARTWNNLGRLRLAAGEGAAGLQALEEAVRLEPTYFLGHSNLAAAAWQLSQFPRAIQAAERALELDPSHAEMRRLLARGRARQGQAAEGVRLLEALLGDQPGHNQARLDLAWMLATSPGAGVRNPEEARSLLKGAPANWEVLEVRAAAWGASGDFAKAVEMVSAALQSARGKVPTGRVTRLERALQQYRAGQPFVATF